MHSTLVFLFGKEIARKMQALDEGLQAIENKHQAYFTSNRSRYALDGEDRAATLLEFVQPRWIAGQPTLEIDSTLPPAIAAECWQCLHQVAALSLLPTATQRFTANLQAFFAPLISKAPKTSAPTKPIHKK